MAQTSLNTCFGVRRKRADGPETSTKRRKLADVDSQLNAPLPEPTDTGPSHPSSAGQQLAATTNRRGRRKPPRSGRARSGRAGKGSPDLLSPMRPREARQEEKGTEGGSRREPDLPCVGRKLQEGPDLRGNEETPLPHPPPPSLVIRDSFVFSTDAARSSPSPLPSPRKRPSPSPLRQQGGGHSSPGKQRGLPTLLEALSPRLSPSPRKSPKFESRGAALVRLAKGKVWTSPSGKSPTHLSSSHAHLLSPHVERPCDDRAHKPMKAKRRLLTDANPPSPSHSAPRGREEGGRGCATERGVASSEGAGYLQGISPQELAKPTKFEEALVPRTRSSSRLLGSTESAAKPGYVIE